MKKINKKILNEIKYNRCQLKFDSVESNYIINLINENLSKNHSIDSVKSALIKFNKLSDVRYYSESHIQELSKNIYDVLTSDDIKKKIYEEVGRNKMSVFKKGYGNISHEKKIELSDSNIDIDDIDVTIDANTGDNIVIFKKNNKLIKKRFASEQEANLFVQNINPFN